MQEEISGFEVLTIEQQVKSKNRFKIGTGWLALLGIFALSSVGGLLFYLSSLDKNPAEVIAPIITATRANVEIKINETGIVEMGSQQSLKSPGEVAVERVLVKVGDRVVSGQQLLILRNPQEQTSLAEQESLIRQQEFTLSRNYQRVNEAEKRLATAYKQVQERVKQQKLEIQKQQLSLARSRQKIEEAKQRLAADQKELQNLEVLAAKGFIPGNELQQQQAKFREAQANLRDAELEARTQMNELQRLTLEQQRPSEQQNNALTALSELREAQSQVNTSNQELKRLQVERQRIKKQLQNNIVNAPISGKVLDIKVRNGDGIKFGDVLLTLGNPAQEEVKLQLGTLDAAKVRVNQLARIKVIGPNPQTFSGRVRSVHPVAISTAEGLVPGQSPQAKVPVTVQLDKPSQTLIPGSQVSVEIVVQQQQNVIALQLEAIQRSEAQPYVWVRDNQGKAQKQNVTLGIEGATTVEIKSGLKPGDKVILPPPETELEPGTPVIEGSPVDQSTDSAPGDFR
ncbi:efflux RND transporter periplasmic adaptor subunit [Nostoc sp. MG11]|uniref:efflux RND transporter periplasmic adaptor subunit n=1 Tax=Nostoc sp. MG11 TaxID=2721166 RepID=UPI001869133C|nr:efflux RND transporter periplasmic adaptor subunit [Nostoc sp. MG11]